jgi:signal transduction histidine kinase
MTTATVAVIFFAEVALIGFLRNEVVKRLAAQQGLIDTLEERVAERTAELEAANDHLRTLSRVKDEFVSNVSHELRTPITSIKLYHGLLTHKPEERDAYLPVLARETERLERLIEDLLTLSRLDQERVEFHSTPVDLNALVQAYTSDRTVLAASREVSLTFEQERDLPQIEADPSLLGQVLSILLTNAFSYTQKGGQVVVSTHQRQTDGQLWVGFSVSDTGPGIPPEEQEQLFTRFFRGRVGRQSGVSGTGLGLAIAKEIVDRHQGQIKIESTGKPGQGTTFSVWLPIQKD